MPAQGIVTIEVSPLNARMIAWWLRTYHKPSGYSGMLADILYPYRDHHDVDSVAKKFEKVIARKRRGPAFANIAIQLSRSDAEWFAKRVRHRGGIFFRQAPAQLPEAVRWVCYRCLDATNKKRGRKMLTRDRLRATLNRSHLDERHRKRLQRRVREEEAANRRSAEFGTILDKAIDGATKST